MEIENKEKIICVSDYIKILNQGLESFQAKIVGEVSDVNFGPTGHVYFTLKDEKDESIIKCVIWKARYNIYGVELKEGVKIIMGGCPQVHKIYGFKFIAEVIEYAGEGTLKKEYEELKKKLAKQGFFEQDRKRFLPKYPQKIGVITSKQGAVLADFLNNLGGFGFKIKMIDSRVEGQAAIVDLLSSIKRLKKEEIEVLVIMRGGGSLESMLAFNNELLVREIIDFPVPVIAAIGHDKDVPLMALAADYAVSTPSIAAISLNKSWEQAESLLKEYERSVIDSYENILKNAYSLLKNSWKRFIFGFNSLLSIIKQQLKHSEEIIYLRNPETQLKLGYSIARCGNKLIKSIKDTKIGEDVDIWVVDGTIISKVKEIKNRN